MSTCVNVMWRGVHLPSLVHEHVCEGDERHCAKQRKALAQQAGRPAGDHNCPLCQDLLGCGQRECAQPLVQVAEGQHITFHLQEQWA